MNGVLRPLVYLVLVGGVIAALQAVQGRRLRAVVREHAAPAAAEFEANVTIGRAAQDLRRRRRLDALARGRTPEARAKLRELHARSKDVARHEVLIAIADHPDPSDEPLLRELTRDVSPRTCLTAYRGLVNLGKADEVFDAVLKFALGGEPALSVYTPEIREDGTPVYHPRALDYCLGALESRHPRVRADAAEGLLRLGRPELGLAALERILAAETRDPDARFRAVVALEDALDVPGARELLEKHRDDADEAIRDAVRDALAPPAPPRAPAREAGK